MTVSSPSGRNYRISPFLLPYILADREDMDRISRTAIEGSPDETLMLSPMEGSPGKASPSRFISPTAFSRGSASPTRTHRVSASPQRRSVTASPPDNHRSVIEASIHDMTFDPDLTFMNSPGNSSAMDDASPSSQTADHLSVSLPVFESPMRAVSPDRSIVPLDESEIGFSNELRASLQQEPSASSRSEETSQDTHGSKRVKLDTNASEKRPKEVTEVPAPVPAVRPRSGRSVKPAVREEVPVAQVLQSANPDEVTPRLKVSSKRKAEVVEESQPASSRPLRKRRVDTETVAPTATVSNQSKPVKKQEVPEDASPDINRAKPKSSNEIIRKSPRFASKVLPTGSIESTGLLMCPNCHKAYKRARDFEKHVGACK